jgi:transposase
MIVHQAYKYRIYPNTEQQQLIRRMFGCCCFVFNHFLEEWNQTYAETGTSQQCHVCGTIHPEVKNLSIREWTCVACGTNHDRDENAAHNIKQAAV